VSLAQIQTSVRQELLIDEGPETTPIVEVRGLVIGFRIKNRAAPLAPRPLSRTAQDVVN
jgi:hypothetical protein